MAKFAIITNDLQFAAANKHEERKKAVRSFLPTQIFLLKEMRKLGVPVIHLQLIVPESDPRSQGIPDELKFTKGSTGAQILREVYEAGDLTVEKPKDSGFYETKLDSVLKSLGVDSIIITGMQTQICVQTTAADAYFRGYKVYVPSDAVISTRAEDTKRALEWLAGYCATVKTSEEIVNLVSDKLSK